MEVLTNKFKDFNVLDRCDLHYNGLSATESSLKIIKEYYEKEVEWNRGQIRPICLMVLDLQMPHKNGIQVIEAIKNYIK